jgi:hypothetical protein
LNGCSLAHGVCIKAEWGVIIRGGYINARGGTVVGEGTVVFGSVEGRTVWRSGWKCAEGVRVSGRRDYGLRGVVGDVVVNSDLLEVHIQVERERDVRVRVRGMRVVVKGVRVGREGVIS